MPELPEVETIKESMRAALENAEILDVCVQNRSLRQPVPDDFEKIIRGTKILHIYRIAKYAIWDLSNGYSIIWHFGMSGKIRILSQKNPVLEKHDHISIILSCGCLIYNDPRRFGLVTIQSSDKLKESSILKHLGIDPFDKSLTGPYLKAKLKNRHSAIKLALLDQTIISGIGNIYASEALYFSGISPRREASGISIKQLSSLIDAVRQVLKKAIAAGGSTLHDYRQPNGNTGYFQFQHAVYGKKGQKCPLCVYPSKKCGGIRQIIQGGRSTYYCPCLQK